MNPSRSAILLVGLLLAACAGEAPDPAPIPTFYVDLASPTAAVDQEQAVEMINAYRARSGIGPLRLDPALSEIAASYARKMADADRMSHSLDPQSQIGPRLKAAGYPFATAGENIAAGYRTLAEAFSGWRDSPRHDRGMKDPEMTVMGIGTAYNPRSKYKVFWCLILARPRTEAPPPITTTPGVVSSPTLVFTPGADPVR